MQHITEIVGYRKLSNGQFAVCIRCCGDASSDSWHTMATTAAAEERAASLDEARVRVAKEHEAAKKTEMEAIALMGDTKTHE